jgi:hypothetical protein
MSILLRYIHIYVCVCVCLYVCNIYIYIYMCACVCMYVRACVCVCVRVHGCFTPGVLGERALHACMHASVRARLCACGRWMRFCMLNHTHTLCSTHTHTFPPNTHTNQLHHNNHSASSSHSRSTSAGSRQPRSPTLTSPLSPTMRATSQRRSPPPCAPVVSSMFVCVCGASVLPISADARLLTCLPPQPTQQ